MRFQGYGDPTGIKIVILTLLIQTLYCLLGQEEEGICSVIRVPLFRVSVCYDKLHRPKIVG